MNVNLRGLLRCPYKPNICTLYTWLLCADSRDSRAGMAFSQLDWIGLFMFGIIVGLPFILEYLRMVWVILPDDFGRGKGRKLKFYERVVWSTEWYGCVKEHAGRLCPALWVFPIVWIGVWFLGTSAVWFVWSNQSDYAQSVWDAFIGMQMAIAFLAIAWHGLFLRSENYVRSAVLSVIIGLLAIASLGIALSGSFKGSSITPDGFLYIPYTAYWIWMAFLALKILIVTGKGGLNHATFTSPFIPIIGAKFYPNYDLHEVRSTTVQ
jgi:tryptophan-rich sensory protein